MTTIPSSLEIASAATLRPIADVAADLGVDEAHLEQYGRGVAKVDLAALAPAAADARRGKYVVVSAVTPTPLGEGKTTTCVGLTQGLVRRGVKAVVTLRQASMGPVFGIKGGAAGGGYSQVVPMERLNLHLTGDFHAVTAAHNLLAAGVDNELHFDGPLGLDPRTVTWRRVLDVNDRSLRNVVLGLGARIDGVPRQSGFDITASSEVMAILTLSSVEDDRACERRVPRRT
jgi:formate--tetrahydrofolate ligase